MSRRKLTIGFGVGGIVGFDLDLTDAVRELTGFLWLEVVEISHQLTLAKHLLPLPSQ